MTPGRIWYLLHRYFAGGLRATYYRTRVRPRILESKPVVTPRESLCELHLLTSTHDLLNAIWCLKSFYHQLPKGDPQIPSLCLHEDGTASEADKALLLHHFPRARLIGRKEADRQMITRLTWHPRCQAVRERNPFFLKLFDVHLFAEAPRRLVVDADLLFFAKPMELLRRAFSQDYTKATWNRDWDDGYSLPASDLEKATGLVLSERINSGLGVVFEHSLNLDLTEEWLAIPGMLDHPYPGRHEQTMVALNSVKGGFEFLPREYDVQLEGPPPGAPCRHYVGPIRHLLYSEGMKRLRKELLSPERK